MAEEIMAEDTTVADTQQVETTMSRDGTPIAYWRSGHGPPLVLVHGTTADHTRWRTVLELLEPHATLCAVDRRGRGRSGDAEPYAIEREFEDIAAVVDAVAATAGGPIDLLGHSHGALCSLEAARLTPNLRKLLLYEPPTHPDPDTYPPGLLPRFDALLAEGRREEMLEAFFRQVVGMPEDELSTLKALPAWQGRVAAAHTLVREEQVSAGYRFDPAAFASLTVPTLLLLGSESPSFLRKSTEAVAAALPDSRIAVLDGQQHVAMDTAPQLFADAVLAFLTET